LEPPYLLKLDTHGFEVPILAGAARTLQGPSVLVIEAYNFTVRDGALRLPQLCGHLEERGFRCLDLVDPLYRSDGALWQVDAVFVRADAPEYRTEAWMPVRS
jgi:hypothetical protein